MLLNHDHLQGDIFNLGFLFSNSPQAIFVFDPKSLMFLGANDAATVIYGYSREEFLEMSIRDIRPAENLKDIEAYSFETAEPYTIESRHTYKSGEIRDVEVTTVPYLHAGSMLRLAYVRDITLKKKRQALLEYLNKAGEELALAIDTETAFSKISALIVPRFADWFTINVINGEQVEFLLIVNEDEGYVNWARQHRIDNPITIHDPGIQGHVIRTREPSLTPRVTDEMLDELIADKDVREIIRKMNLRSSVVAPMVVKNEVIGTINFVSSTEGRYYDDVDVSFAKDLATRIALALENARLHEEARAALKTILNSEQEAQAMNEELMAMNEELSATNEQLTMAHAQIQESEERFKLAIDNTEAGVFDTDLITGITIRSAKHAQIYGYPDNSEEWNIEKMQAHIHPRDLDKAYESYKHSLETGVLNSEFRIRQPEGTVRWINTIGRIYYSKQLEPLRIVGTVADITERKELQRQKDEFISTVSHELKTPVTSIKAYAQFLRRTLVGDENSRNKNFLERMDVQINRLENLIKGLLDTTRIESGKFAFNLAQLEMSGMLNDLISDLQLIHPSHKLTIVQNMPITVYADKDRLIQVVTNFITNAVKYSPEANEVRIHLKTVGSKMIFSVEDFGTGIPAEQYSYIFERFHQGANSDTNIGLGLGLYISKEIILKHGGEIWFESQFGKGSVFYFSLPVT